MHMHLKEFGMTDHHEAQRSDLSQGRTNALFLAALGAALLGLTVLDVAPAHSARHPDSLQRDAAATRSVDCLVAQAVFAGVSASPLALR
jgi:hypothetical protein